MHATTDPCIVSASRRRHGNAADVDLVSSTLMRGWLTSKRTRELLEAFISNEFRPVLDSKRQETKFELTSSGAIEAVKRREQRKGHFLSVLRGFGTTNQMRLMLEKLGVTFTYPKPVDQRIDKNLEGRAVRAGRLPVHEQDV